MSAVEWSDTERETVAERLVYHWRTNPTSGLCSCGHEVPLGHWFTAHLADEALNALGPHVAAREAQAAARASVLRGHLDALRKALFEDAATDHDMRLRKAHAVIRQVEKMEPFENAYASLRVERDALAARLAAVERALDDEEANLADDGARLSHAVVRRLRAALATKRKQDKP